MDTSARIGGEQTEETPTHWRTILLFFLPLGFSASLVTVSHVIIHSTLARAPNPEAVIASYAVALSFFAVFERNAIMLRPTAAKLIQDHLSFRAVSRVTLYVLLIVMAITLTIAFTPLGAWVFTYMFGVERSLLPSTLDAYKVLVFVTIFSIIRCLFQGIIIGNLRTKWMTIGMVIRLFFMATVAWVFLYLGWVEQAYIGSVIFLIGMAIEALVSALEGTYLLKKLPKRRENHHIDKSRHVLSFYYPLLFASFMAVLVQPSINAMLSWSEKGALAVASFAVAWSFTQLFLSFTTYIHQIVLNFHRKNGRAVLRFALGVNFIPGFVLGCIAFTPLGPWVLQHIVGLSGELLVEGIRAIKFFLIYALVFPWLDFCHGLVMVRGNTPVMAFTQACNIVMTWIMLGVLVFITPSLGGAIGAIAQGTGFLFELLLILCILNISVVKKGRTEKGIQKAKA
ncbi:multi antimicrobial extrusion protein MatE [Caldalkalibacillus salinus]|uniref:multi antimicrobial extrusion protein MatE n=1 Tax=Caldalkalibacillus salinus TaxID=2803787 RepID=UPI001924948B|nr:multi antimicrobial extrusion protein MatE [Caldalkalibacillus salinus]